MTEAATGSAPGRSQRSAAEQSLLSLAARQHGVISMVQIEAAGLSRSWVRRGLREGALEPWPVNVFRVRLVRASSPETAATAACLALGPAALVSHDTAARLWDLDVPARPGPPHVLLPYGMAGRPEVRAVVHHSRQLSSRDRALVGRLPVTTVSRTLVDLAAAMSAERYVAVVDDALIRGVAQVGRLQRAAARLCGSGRPGSALVAEALAIWSHGGIESQAEALLARLVLNNALPPPDRQYQVSDSGGRSARLDAAWPELNVVVEVDGFLHHSARDIFVSDRQRTSWLTSMGWTVLHTTVAELRAGAPDLLAALTRLGVAPRRPGRRGKPAP